ncbi:vacuolar protein sorting-associated protein 35 [[Candida] railenensis]|uniref:Vacuolar protein sorting-associated protein 35 n=1 Tax=[Candida] railenensis TaxID=45579 RepID=A0A9P0VZA0_9ASCO|nr:vacuolar protein sorting-associated protein 35 [[Candida] railenensis]
MPATSQSEQKAILQSHLANIKNQSNLMKQCLSENNLLQALKHCSNMLNELRTNQLTPKFYYELYMIIFDSLEILSTNLLASHKRRNKKKGSNNSDASGNSSAASSATPFLADLYELVQYSGNIIPRLYMMIVVGTTYISTKDAPTKEIMKDMIEMCRGVQHPIRGLFLRYYLSQRIKDLLPISTRQDFDETVEFLISNFIEMNKLWVRLQHQGHSSERELRFRERKELKILVGSNLVRLSQIIDDYSEVDHPAGDAEYRPIEYYKDRIFSVIVEQIIQCRDHLAQSYLIDVIIQIFPVNFHFATLSMLLQDVFLYLNPTLRKSELVSTLVERFIVYHKFESDSEIVSRVKLEDKKEGKNDVSTEPTEAAVVEELNGSDFAVGGSLFDAFWEFYVKLSELDPELPSEEHSTILQAIIKLSLTYEPDNYDNLDKVYKYASKKLSSRGEEKSENADAEDELWLQLLIVPIEHFKTMKNLLELSYFYEFYSSLQNPKFKKQISLAIVEKVLSINETFSDHGEIDGIFRYLLVLIKDTAADQHKWNTAKNLGITQSFQIENGSKIITKDFLKIQENISKILHLLTDRQDPFKSLSNLMYVRKKYLNKSGENMIYTYPSLINQILNQLKIAGYRRKYLIKKKKESQKDEGKEEIESDDSELLLLTTNFKNLSVTIGEFYQIHQQLHSELILNLYLNAAGIADQLELESISYELFTQCFIVYEENLILNSSGGVQNQNPHDVMGSGSIPYQSVIAIANKLSASRYFSKENYENLITKITLYASKLLKKQDQCRSVYYCAHLWWWCELFIEGSSPTVEKEKESGTEEEKKDAEVDSAPRLYREPKRVLECLQKSLRVADSCMDPFLSLRLFIEILNRCLIFYIYGNYLVDSRYINGLIDLIKTNLENLKSNNGENEDDNQTYIRIERLFRRSLDYIDEQKAIEDRFQDIVV